MTELRRELLAEFLGTAVLIVFGIGSVAQAVFSGNANGNFISINLGWGLAVMMGVYIAGGVSGAHLNPAVTLAMAVRRGFPWNKVLPYSLAQFLGAFAGAAVVYVAYYEALNHFDGGVRQVVGDHATAGIWATYPQMFLSNFPGGLIDQVLGTALLVLVIFAITDKRNSSPSPALLPLIVGCTVALIGMTFGYNSGYAINPARDLAPRIFTALFGWGNGVFSASHYWWWVPVVGPCLGAIAGGTLYDLLIQLHHPKEVVPS